MIATSDHATREDALAVARDAETERRFDVAAAIYTTSPVRDALSASRMRESLMRLWGHPLDPRSYCANVESIGAYDGSHPTPFVHEVLAVGVDNVSRSLGIAQMCVNGALHRLGRAIETCCCAPFVYGVWRTLSPPPPPPPPSPGPTGATGRSRGWRAPSQRRPPGPTSATGPSMFAYRLGIARSVGDALAWLNEHERALLRWW